MHFAVFLHDSATTVLGGSFSAILPLTIDLKEEIAHILCSYEPCAPFPSFGNYDWGEFMYTPRAWREHIYSKYSFSEAISIAWETAKSKSIESAVGLGSIDSTSPWILHSCPCCAESKVHRKPESSAFYKEPKDKNAFKEEN